MPDHLATPSPLVCYRCSASLATLTLPLARLDTCPECSVELHVCRMCTHYAPRLPDACDEEDAPEFRNKTAANFCDYFAPNAAAFDGKEQHAENKARAELDALFGGSADSAPAVDEVGEADALLQRADELFKK